MTEHASAEDVLTSEIEEAADETVSTRLTTAKPTGRNSETGRRFVTSAKWPGMREYAGEMA
jgi:hypothetical protein